MNAIIFLITVYLVRWFTVLVTYYDGETDRPRTGGPKVSEVPEVRG